jgi:hypothetical protein
MRLEVVTLAWPLFRVPVPIVLLPSLNVTVPGGNVPGAPVTTTFAVKVTACLCGTGLREDVTVVLVAAFAVFTTCGAAFPLLFAHPLAPVN